MKLSKYQAHFANSPIDTFIKNEIESLEHKLVELQELKNLREGDLRKYSFCMECKEVLPYIDSINHMKSHGYSRSTAKTEGSYPVYLASEKVD